MVNVILQDANGTPLNILDGSSATLSVSLPASIVASAPDEIPLWSFNEEFGIWVEEGLATKINGNYVGEVTHFSWWNCDAPFPIIELDLTIVDENGIPVAGNLVGISFVGDNVPNNYSYTNSEGFITGKVPANITLLLQIRGLCQETVYSTIIGPFNEDTSLGNLFVDDSEINNTRITGSLLNCAGELVTDGGITVSTGDGNYITTVDNGAFSLFISTCDEEADLTISGVDFNEELISDPISGLTGTTINTGTIEVCNNLTSLLTMTVDSEVNNYFGGGLAGNIDANNISITFESAEGPVLIVMTLNGTEVGNYATSNIGTYFDGGAPYSLQNIDPSTQQVVFSTFNITQVSPNIVGSFGGMARDDSSGGTPVSVSGSFRIVQ